MHIWKPWNLTSILNPIVNKQRSFVLIAFVAAIIVCLSFNGAAKYITALPQQQFSATLSGSSEVPPVQSSATGAAKFTLSADNKSLLYVLTVTGIDGVTGSYIHAGKSGENGPAIVGLFNPGMLGPPTAKKNGVLANGNLTSADLQGTMPGKQISDLVTLMKGHGAYVSINTQQHQNGEIRGQIG